MADSLACDLQPLGLELHGNRRTRRDPSNPDAASLLASMPHRHALTGAQGQRIKDLLPSSTVHIGRPLVDKRLFVDAVLHRYRAGIA